MDMPDGDSQYLSVRATAQRLGVHENTVRNWVKQGVLQSARIPGSRFHRFEAEEVERLQRARGASVAPVQDERRMIGPELVDATRLSGWAGRQQARRLFPKLLRRLLAASPGIQDLSMRAGEGTDLEGYDGRATATDEVRWVPAGRLRFELGVGTDPKRKAESEYEKRSADPKDVAPADTWFIFATPRRWPGGASWAAEREAAGPWRGVRVIDADDLEGWLEATPAVHYWISEELGLRPRDVLTLEKWWRQFSERTSPALPPPVFIAGREPERDRLEERLAAPADSIGVCGASRDDALGFVSATIGVSPEEEPARPALVVSSADAWDRLIAEPSPITLIPTYTDPAINAAVAAGKHVVVPFGREEVRGSATIELPRPDRAALREALNGLGIEFDRADKLAALARRSMGALVRSLARDPKFERPAWGRPPVDAVFAPLTLVGAWSATESDQELVSRLVGDNWSTIERELLRARATDDPPFILSGTQWRLASAEEAFSVLHGSLTSEDLARWTTIAVEVLLEDDPAVDLSDDERPMAGLIGKVRAHSTALRRGLAEGSALLASFDDVVLADGVSCADHARSVVSAIMDRANADSSGRVWQSLAGELSLLAEAAPEAFLESVIDGTTGSPPVLETMFRDSEDTSWLGTSSPHTGLLWALETLCWSPEHLMAGTEGLARLAQIDPGGRLSNRPIASLRTILLPWLPHTAAPLDHRTQALAQINRLFPDLAWNLLLALWPAHHSSAMPSASPRFRDWKPNDRGVAVADWLATIGHLVGLAINGAGTDAGRWGQLIERLGPLPPDERERLIDALDASAEAIAHDVSDRLLLWEVLTGETERHRAFPSAAWSMDDATLGRLASIADRIEPTQDVERFGRLFDWRPDIGGRKYQDRDAYNAVLRDLQEQAVRDTLADAGVDGLARLAERSPVPRRLGWVVSEVFGDAVADPLLSWLGAEGKRREVARAWIASRANAEGARWVEGTLAKLTSAPLDHRRAVALEAPPKQTLWNFLEQTSEELRDAYWQNMQPFQVETPDVGVAARRLLDYRRPWTTIDLLAMHVHNEDGEAPGLTTDLVIEALEAGLAAQSLEEAPTQSLGYELGLLLDFLEAHDTEASTLAHFEWQFFRWLEDHREPRALYGALDEHPELFVDLVSKVYRGKNEPRRSQDENAALLAQHAWWVLNAWPRVPGAAGGDGVDAEHLDRWVTEARLLLSERDRSDIGDEQIGQVLARSPHGRDEAWPAEAVRDLIERVGSPGIETGLHVGAINGRGVTSRGAYEGGDQERVLAARYRKWADQTASRWRRTSRVLQGLATTYEHDARREDMRAELDADSD